MGKDHLGGKVHKVGSDAAAIMAQMEQALAQLERDNAADKKGIIEFDTNLGALRKEEEQLKHHIENMEYFCASLVSEEGIGAALKQFDSMEAFLKSSYGKVLERHKAGIEMLKKEFGYHPAYKRGRDNEFTASWFTPVRDPNNVK